MYTISGKEQKVIKRREGIVKGGKKEKKKRLRVH